MSPVAESTHHPRRSAVLSGLSSPALIVLALVVVTILSVIYQQRWGTITDTSWLITVNERMMAGERLYIDVVDPNPPFSIWLYRLPVLLATSIGIAPEILVHASTYAAALAGLLLAGLVLRRAGFAEAPKLIMAAPAIYALLVLFPGNAFTQREHIGIALFLPMLALMAWRMRGGVPGAAMSVAVGLCASVLLLVKPYYALLVLLPVLATCWRNRSPRPLLALEHWVIALVCAAYLAAVVVLHPAFLSDIYPLVAGTYMKIRAYRPMLLLYGPAAGLLALALVLLWPKGRVSELAMTYLLAAVGGAVTLVLQGKGWPYHAYPALLCTMLTALVLLCRPEFWPHTANWRRIAGIAALVAGIAAGSIPFRLAPKPSDTTVAAITAAAPNPTVMSIAVDIASAHPLSRMLDGDDRSRHPSLWMVRAAKILADRSTDESERQRLETLRDRFIAEAAQDIEDQQPDIVLDGGVRETLAAKAIHADPAMRRALNPYAKLYSDDAVTVWVRGKLGEGM